MTQVHRLISILGAGRATRFGADKLAKPCAGKPVGQWVLDAACATGLPVAWVAAEEAPAFVGEQCVIVHNPKALRGIGTSVAAAAAFADDNGVDELLIILADMPLVTTSLLDRLIGQGAPAACRYPGGEAGVPALVPRAAFHMLANLCSDQGAARLLSQMGGLRLVACEPDTLIDVDRPSDLARAQLLLRGRADSIV